MKPLLAFLLLASTALAQSDLDIAIAIAKAKAKAKGQQSYQIAAVVPVDSYTDVKRQEREAAVITPPVSASNRQNTPANQQVLSGDHTDPNFAHANLRWDAQHNRYLSADGRYAAAPGGKFQPRQWRTIPAQGHYVRQKVCHGTWCEYKNVWIQTAPAKQVEVFGALLPADQQPAPMEGVGAGLRALNPQPGEVLVDYGCGHDARWLIAAVRDFGVTRAIGVEIDPEAAESARRYVAQAGLSDRIEIVTGDATTANVRADIGVAYLWPDTLGKLRPQIQKLDRFVSFGHDVPGLATRQNGDLYVYEKPRAVPVSIPARPAMAEWGGRMYSGPVCNRRNCSMCNAIRAQLAGWY